MKRKVEPLSPDAVATAFAESIPDFVIEAVNNLLQTKAHQGQAILRQDDIINECVRLAMQDGSSITRNQIFDNHWLDIEPIFEAAGWIVNYDRPGHGESYAATFEFTDKRKA